VKPVYFTLLSTAWLVLCLFSLSPAGQAGSFPDCPQIQAPLPADVHEAVIAAEALADKGMFTAAAQSLSAFAKAHPTPSFAYVDYDIGFFHYQARAFDKAVPYLKKAVDQAPCFAQGHQLLANALYDTKDAGAAAPVMEKAAAMAKDPDLTMDLTFQAALFWTEAKSPKKALPLLQKLEAHTTPRSEWLVALSHVLGMLEKKKETARAMEKAARAGNDPDLFFHAAWLWLEADQPRKALVLLETLARRKTVNTDWLLLLCNTYMALDRPADAARTMDRAAEQDPVPENLYTGGVLWLQVEKPVKARKHLLRLTSLPEPEADWFVALGQSWAMSQNIDKAAPAIEKAFAISKKPDHAYQAGVMRLQLKQPDKALPSLLFLETLPAPKADWLAALSNAWVMKDDFVRAAPVMERAASISKKDSHYFRAAQLWLQAEKPARALPLLLLLAEKPAPKAEWLILLSNTHLLLEEVPDAAKAMERAAGISQKGTHYYRAAMLWHQAGDGPEILDKTIALLRLSVAAGPVEQRWLIDLADRLVQTRQNKEALSVMERTRLAGSSEPPALCYRGALVWIKLQQPGKALPVLEFICKKPGPEYAWLASLVRLNMELARHKQADFVLLQLLEAFPGDTRAWKLAVWTATEQADYARAAAAMAVALHLDPGDTDSLNALGRYYQMAGVPAKAAAVFQKAAGPAPGPDDWDRIKEVYVSGKLYDKALEAARAAAAAAETPARWEAVGDIAFLLHRYADSARAYARAADLSDTDPVRLKTAYALMKQDKLVPAARLFQEILDQDKADAGLRREASQALAYVRSIQALMPESDLSAAHLQ
jgi:tetratricopeptide (TPR) repeat protein